MRSDLREWRDPAALVETDALEAALGDPDLRIVDCTTWLMPVAPGDDVPYRVVPGTAEYDAGHVPGAVFLDIQGEISDLDTRLRFMAPSAARFADAVGRLGIGNGSRVVLYANGSIMWATRVWWMFRAFGFDGAAVLDGGFAKWQAERRPVTTDPGGYPPTRFEARPRPGFFADSDHVLARLEDEGSAMVNALAPAFHLGDGPSRYGRPGRIPGSVNVPAANLLDPSDGTFVSFDEARNGPTRRPASLRTGTSSPIAGAGSPRPSAFSCCTSSATRTSPSTTDRWASGRTTPSSPSRPARLRTPADANRRGSSSRVALWFQGRFRGPETEIGRFGAHGSMDPARLTCQSGRTARPHLLEARVEPT